MRSVTAKVVCVVLGTALFLGHLEPQLAAEKRNGSQRQENEPFMPWDFRTFADPEKFFEQFFGADHEADRRALQDVTVSAAEEKAYGNRAAQAFLTQLRQQGVEVVQRGKEVDYLHRLVGLVQPCMRNRERYTKFQIYLVQSDETEAKCFPGGTLMFFRGMLESADSEATLVGVIGHELSHIDHGHQLDTLRRLKLAEQTFSGRSGAGSQQFFRNGMLAMKAFTHPFRPEDEAEADRDAATWSFQLGYDPRELAELFRRWHDRKPDERNAMPAFFRSHPFHIERYRATLDVFHKLQESRPDQPLYIGRENLRQRMTRDQRRFPE